MGRYAVVSRRCRLTARASSSVHPITAEAHALSGEIDAELRDGALDLDRPASARIELSVAELRADNPLVSREIRKRLDPRRHPSATLTAHKVSARAEGGYDVFGELTLHQVTRSVTARAVLLTSDRHGLELDAELTFDVREFQLQPPSLLGLRVHPEVTVAARVVAAVIQDYVIQD